MKSASELHDILRDNNGTTAYHKYSLFPGYPVITDGVLALAEAAECFWFLDIIGSYQGDKKLDPAFQVWTLDVNLDDNTAIARGLNDTDVVITQTIPFTDFPLESVKFFLIDGVILLPSEY